MSIRLYGGLLLWMAAIACAQQELPPSGQTEDSAPRAVPVEGLALPDTRGRDGQADDPSRPVSVRIVSPREREIVPTSVVDVFIEVDNYTLAEGGNRLHVLVNNQAPVPWTDIRRPFPIRDLSEGGHTVRVLAVRPDGTMLRDGAFAMVHFYVRRKNFQNYTDPEAPFLTVNLPGDGVAELDAQGRLCFDYRAHNADFQGDSGLVIKYQLDAYEGELREEGPVYWSNLVPGRHKLVVELFDRTGQPVFGPFNRVERNFEVRPVLRAVPVAPDDTNAASHPELGH